MRRSSHADDSIQSLRHMSRHQQNHSVDITMVLLSEPKKIAVGTSILIVPEGIYTKDLVGLVDALNMVLGLRGREMPTSTYYCRRTVVRHQQDNDAQRCSPTALVLFVFAVSDVEVSFEETRAGTAAASGSSFDIRYSMKVCRLNKVGNELPTTGVGAWRKGVSH